MRVLVNRRLTEWRPTEQDGGKQDDTRRRASGGAGARPVAGHRVGDQVAVDLHDGGVDRLDLDEAQAAAGVEIRDVDAQGRPFGPRSGVRVAPRMSLTVGTALPSATAREWASG
jgi:hypothetical protein